MKKVLKFLKIQKYLILILVSLTVAVVANVITRHNNDNKKVEDEIKAIEVASFTKDNLVIEVGSILPEAKEYFKDTSNIKGDPEISYYLDGKEINEDEICKLQGRKCITNNINNFKVIITIDKEEYNSNLLIVDTTPPEVTTKELTKVFGSTYTVKEFIKTYSDNSGSKEYNANYVDESQANIKDVGTTAIKIEVCDISKNCTTADGRLVIEKKVETNPKTSSGSSGSKTSKKPSGGSTSKPSGGSSSKPSGGSSSGSSGSSGSGSSGSSGSSGGSTTPKTCTEQDKVEKVITHQTIKYGTQENKYVNVTYHINKDCSKTEKSRTGEKSEVVYSTFNGTVKTMKSEATSIQSSLSSVKNKILTLTNNCRIGDSSSPSKCQEITPVGKLTLDYNLSVIATLRAMEMAYANKFSHTRPNGKQWHTIWDDYGLQKGNIIGENLGKGYTSPEGVTNGWINSATHFENLVNTRFKKIGIGKYTYQGVTYWAQEFSS